MDKINLFYETAVQYKHEHPAQRLGQVYFNVLHVMRTDLANEIRGTAFDPFYKKDDELVAFAAWLGGKLS